MSKHCEKGDGCVHAGWCEQRRDGCPRHRSQQAFRAQAMPDNGLIDPGYPDDNPKTAIGAAKPPLHVIPPIALLHMGQAMRDGATKYGAFNWREKTISSSTYYDAAMRHLLAWWDGENVAPDSGVHHLAHAMACLALILDGDSVGKLNDNRPKAHGAAGAFIAGKAPG